MAKKITLYGILTALCIVLGYIESLISLDFIAPGVKIGLSNAVVLSLVAAKDIKGAFMVNMVRILLSGLLFSYPIAMLFSLSGGICSIIVMLIFSKIKAVSVFGMGVAGAVAHNLAQLCCATVLLGVGVWYYSPILLISAVICGMLTAFVSKLIIKKYTN